MNSPGGQVSKQVKTVSPLLPISVLVVSSATAFRTLIAECLVSPHAQPWKNTCHALAGRYISAKGFETADGIICFAVQFFTAGMNDLPTRILLAEFFALIAVIALIGTISANRSSAGVLVKYGTTFAYMLFQGLGAAVVTPLYFALIVLQGSKSARASFVPSGWARTLLPTLFLAYVLPSLPILLEGICTDYQREMILALWQPFPIYMSIISASLALLFTGTGTTMSTSDAMVSTTLIISSMDFIVLMSAVLHFYSIYLVYINGVSLTSFIPVLELASGRDIANKFFTVDLLGCLVSIWTLIFYDTSRFSGVGKTSVAAAALISVFGTVLLGPGGAAAWAWANIEKARLGALVADRPRKVTEPLSPNLPPIK